MARVQPRLSGHFKARVRSVGSVLQSCQTASKYCHHTYGKSYDIISISIRSEDLIQYDVFELIVFGGMKVVEMTVVTKAINEIRYTMSYFVAPSRGLL